MVAILIFWHIEGQIMASMDCLYLETYKKIFHLCLYHA